MADIKISQLTAAVQVQDSDVLPMTSGSSTVKVSAQQLKSYATDGLDASDSAVLGSYVTAVSESNGVISVTREAADATPTENSNKMVKSGGVYSALSGKQNTLTFDNVPTSGSNNPVKSGGIYTALEGKEDALTFDSAPTQNSDNPVKSGGVFAALQNAGHTIKDDTTTYTKRQNLIFKGFYLDDDPTGDATIVSKNKPIPSWSNGSDADIIEALQKHYDGEIDLHDYWAVGDERTIDLSAMAATYVGESHPATTVTFVLMNAGGKKLSDGTTDCAFVVGMKEILYPAGWMNNTNTNNGSWSDTPRRTWCNNVFYNALPSSIKSIFKEFINATGRGGGMTSGTFNSTDYFALPAEIEVFGTNSVSISGEGTIFKYYETAANRTKIRTDTQENGAYWLRSPRSGNSTQFCYNDRGSVNYGGAYSNLGLSPFGCI